MPARSGLPRTLTEEELRRIGHLLFGREWIGPLARALGVRTAQVIGWQNKGQGLPDEFHDALTDLVFRRLAELQDWHRRLFRQAQFDGHDVP